MLEKTKRKDGILRFGPNSNIKNFKKYDSMMPLSAIYQMVLHKEVNLPCG